MTGFLLSICIPTYNRKEQLEQAISSMSLCAEGKEKEIELCISDNASTDGTYQFLQGMQRKSKISMKISKNDENLGFDANLLKVLEMSKGKWVWLFGDDDYPDRQAFSELMGFLSSETGNKLLLVQGRYVYKEDYIPSTKAAEYARSIEPAKRIMKKTPTFMSGLIIRGDNVRELLMNNKSDVMLGVGTHVLHSWVIRLIFLKNQNATWADWALPLVVTRVSSYDVPDPGRQLRFMSELTTYPVFSLAMAIKKRAFGFIPVYLLELLSTYTRFVFNIIIARKYRHIRAEGGMLSYFLAKYGICSAFFLCPYLVFTIAPVFVSEAIYGLVTHMAIRLKIENEVSLKNSIERWRVKG